MARLQYMQRVGCKLQVGWRTVPGTEYQWIQTVADLDINALIKTLILLLKDKGI